MANNEELKRFLTLSKREKEALGHFCQGLTYKEIAKNMVVELGTVSSLMSRAYKKLGLFELSQVERVRHLAEVYCPLFNVELEAPEEHPEEIIDAETNEIVLIDEVIVMPLPAEEKILKADEKALVALRKESFKAEQRISKKKKSKGGGCRKFFGRLVALLVVIVIVAGAGVWYLWQNDALDLLPFDLSEFINIPQVAATDSPSSSSSNTAPTQKPASVQVNTPKPAPTSTPKPLITGPVYEVGEWHKEGDLWIRLFDYEIKGGEIYFTVEIWNKGSQDLLFQWSTYQNTFLIDNLGNHYDLDSKFDRKEDDELIPAGTKMILGADPYVEITTVFDTDYLYQSGVTDIYLTLEYLSRVEKATWHISIGK